MKKINATKKALIPVSLPRFTQGEEEMLFDRFYLPGWQFETTILPHLTLIEDYSVFTGYDDEDRMKFEDATLYGLKGVRVENNQSIIANFFLRHEDSLYQSKFLQPMLDTLEVLRKDARRDLYYQQKKERKNHAKTPSKKQLRAA